MPWRYGIVKFRHSKDPDFRFYGVGELYFDKDPLSPFSCTKDPVEPYLEHELESTEESVKKDMQIILEQMMKDCIAYPIFDIDGPFAKSPWDEKSTQGVGEDDTEILD